MELPSSPAAPVTSDVATPNGYMFARPWQHGSDPVPLYRAHESRTGGVRLIVAVNEIVGVIEDVNEVVGVSDAVILLVCVCDDVMLIVWLEVCVDDDVGICENDCVNDDD